MISVEREREKNGKNRWFLPLLWSLWMILKRLSSNIWAALFHRMDMEQRTWQYPEEPRRYEERTRLVHRLVKRPDGRPKCVACELCSTVCPTQAIEMVVGDSAEPDVGKFPQSFAIDELRCMYCGFCVNVCPKDALRMDTELGDLVGTKREDLVFDLESLLSMPPRPGASLIDKELEAGRRDPEQSFLEVTQREQLLP
ncbi:MAG: hypothetical protein CL920_02370 [Deltaproteobacteria bacterium]|nr:hypothetical protein [Deltaproteobacteria bacterium]|tara:strand:- start:450 stop:1043 length:594 start_codon:yes stop_codon:yes gene_type:complete